LEGSRISTLGGTDHDGESTVSSCSLDDVSRIGEDPIVLRDVYSIIRSPRYRHRIVSAEGVSKLLKASHVMPVSIESCDI
jgi:hypothetical protein